MWEMLWEIQYLKATMLFIKYKKKDKVDLHILYYIGIRVAQKEQKRKLKE